MIKVIKKRSGITMMALIITIIVMVILAGTVSTLSILNIREVKSRTYKSDMAKIQKAFYDYFENTLTNSEKRETNDKLEEIRKRTITSNISGGSLQENNITIPEKNIYNARYVKVTKELMNLLDIKYTGDMQTYISLKDLKIKKGTLIASILRDGKMIFPGGNDAIKINDSVMVVTTASSIEDFDDILE